MSEGEDNTEIFSHVFSFYDFEELTLIPGAVNKVSIIWKL